MGKWINTDAAYAVLTDYYHHSTETQHAALREALGRVETVDAVPVVHGRWIDIDSEMYTWKIRCSKCGHERSMMSTGQIYPMYCEDCGTRMDGKDGEGRE